MAFSYCFIVLFILWSRANPAHQQQVVEKGSNAGGQISRSKMDLQRMQKAEGGRLLLEIMKRKLK